MLCFIAALIAGTAGIVMRRRESTPDGEAEDIGDIPANEAANKPDQINLADVAGNSALSLQLGYGLIEMVDEASGGPLIWQSTGIKKQVSRALDL